MPLNLHDKPKRRKRPATLTLNILTRTPDGTLKLERRVTKGAILLGLFDPLVSLECLARAIQSQPKPKRKVQPPCR